MMGWNMGGMMWWWGMALLGLMVLVLLALVVGAAMYLSRQGQRASDQPGIATDAALELLRRRYAAGEIDDDEYNRRLSVMGVRR